MGYDYVRVEISLPLPAVSYVTQDTAEGQERHNRAWQSMTEGCIRNWEEFDKYPWPCVDDSAFQMHEYICRHLPDGMGFITSHAGGVFEHLSRLVSYQGLCLMLYDNPQLFQVIADRLGGLIEQYNRRLLQLDRLAAIFQGEDFGFNTQTLLPPDVLRQYFLPWHKKYACMCHDAGRPYFLHSCGKIDAVMEDLMDDVKIDGKHSFQDGAVPVADWKRRYGDRIALIGGVDVNVLATYSVPELRKYVRTMIDACAAGGRFAIGSGNSVPSYVPVENYLAMVEESMQ
jgi:uroporphyrinogen decarboxylase